MPEEIKIEAAVLSNVGPPLWRLQLVRTLQILGVLATVLGGAEFMGIAKVLSPQIAGWLALYGAGLRFGAEPLIMLIGDLIDDGIQNNSFQIPKKTGLFLLFGGLALFSGGLVACTSAGFSLGITPEGCAMATYTQNGKTYSTGPCIGPDGKIDRYRAQWRNGEGIQIRAERVIKTGQTELQYQANDGSWITWDSKAGVMLGQVPAGVQTPILNEK